MLQGNRKNAQSVTITINDSHVLRFLSRNIKEGQILKEPAGEHWAHSYTQEYCKVH